MKCKSLANILLVVFTIFAVSGCHKMNRTISIRKSHVQNMIEKKFPIEKSMILAKIKLDSPSVYFSEEHLGMKLHYSADLLNQHISGMIDFTGKLVYKQENTTFYFSDIDIREITLNGEKLSENNKLNGMIATMTSKYFNDLPLYRLDQKNFRQNIARFFLREIKIKDDRLVIIMGKDR